MSRDLAHVHQPHHIEHHLPTHALRSEFRCWLCPVRTARWVAVIPRAAKSSVGHGEKKGKKDQRSGTCNARRARRRGTNKLGMQRQSCRPEDGLSWSWGSRWHVDEHSPQVHHECPQRRRQRSCKPSTAKTPHRVLVHGWSHRRRENWLEIRPAVKIKENTIRTHRAALAAIVDLHALDPAAVAFERRHAPAFELADAH